MPVSEKKKISNARWDKKNFGTLVCKVYKSDAQAFRTYAAKRGKSVNELLREYVSVCLGRPLERRSGEPEKEQEQTNDIMKYIPDSERGENDE